MRFDLKWILPTLAVVCMLVAVGVGACGGGGTSESGDPVIAEYNLGGGPINISATGTCNFTHGLGGTPSVVHVEMTEIYTSGSQTICIANAASYTATTFAVRCYTVDSGTGLTQLGSAGSGTYFAFTD